MAQLSEFQLIRQFFSQVGAGRKDVLLGMGDDAALLDCGRPELLAICVDTLTSGVHFPHDTPADAVGHKALAVNLSDLAAMGASPAWALLALSLPDVDSDWLDGFRRGFHELAKTHGVALVGGDTTRGELAASVTLAGMVKAADALRREGAKPGDGVYVSGTLGDAAAGLKLWQAGRRPVTADEASLIERLMRPQPRVALGCVLRGLASAAIDVSDGLLADLSHILERSAVGATVDLRRLPLSGALRACFGAAEAEAFAMSGGDDYELCFTVPAMLEPDLARRVSSLDLSVTRIGTIEAEPSLRLVDHLGQIRLPQHVGFEHFGRQS